MKSRRSLRGKIICVAALLLMITAALGAALFRTGRRAEKVSAASPVTAEIMYNTPVRFVNNGKETLDLLTLSVNSKGSHQWVPGYYNQLDDDTDNDDYRWMVNNKLEGISGMYAPALHFRHVASVASLDGDGHLRWDSSNSYFTDVLAGGATLTLDAANVQLGDTVYFAYVKGEPPFIFVTSKPASRVTAEFENPEEQKGVGYVLGDDIMGGGDVSADDLKAQFRVKNAGYTFKQSGTGMLNLVAATEMLFAYKGADGNYADAYATDSLQDAITKAGEGSDITIYVVRHTRDGKEEDVPELAETVTIPAGKHVTLTSVTRAVSGADGTEVTWEEWKTADDTATLKRGDALAGAMIVVEEGAELTVQNLILDGGAAWTKENPSSGEWGVSAEKVKIKDDGKGGAGTVETNNKGVTAHAPVLVNQGTLTLGSGAIVQNNDNNYAKPGEGFGSQNYGGGVRNEGGGTFKMTAGSAIRDCYSREGGGIMNINKAKIAGDTTVTIEGGTITGNVSQMKGAAIQTIYGSAATIVQGGEISGNISLHDLGVLTVEEGGALTVSGGTVSAADGKNALYLYNQYDEKTYADAPANAKPYIEGEKAGTLNVTGSPTITGKVHLDDSCTVVDTETGTAGTKQYESILDVTGYEGGALALHLNEGRPAGKVAVAESGADFNALLGVTVADSSNNLSDIIYTVGTENGKSVLSAFGYEITVEQTEPGKLTVKVTLQGEGFTGVTIDEVAAEEEGGVYSGEVTFTENASQTVNIVLQRAAGDFTVTATLGAVIFDADEETLKTPENTQYVATDGTHKDAPTGGKLPTDLAIDGDGYAEFYFDGETEARRIHIGTREAAPTEHDVALYDVGANIIEIQNAKAGLEYALLKDGEIVTGWQTATDGKVTFAGLTEGTEYTVVVRTPKGTGTLASGYAECTENGATAKITTLTEMQQGNKDQFVTEYNDLKTLKEGGENPGAAGFTSAIIQGVLDNLNDAGTRTAELPSILLKKVELEGWHNEASAAEWKADNSEILEKASATSPEWNFEADATAIRDALDDFDKLPGGAKGFALDDREKLIPAYIQLTCDKIEAAQQTAGADDAFAEKYAEEARDAGTPDEADLAYEKAVTAFALDKDYRDFRAKHADMPKAVADLAAELLEDAIAAQDGRTSTAMAETDHTLATAKFAAQLDVLEALIGWLAEAEEKEVTELAPLTDAAENAIAAIGDAASTADVDVEKDKTSDILHRGFFMAALETKTKDAPDSVRDLLSDPDFLAELETKTGDDIDTFLAATEKKIDHARLVAAFTAKGEGEVAARKATGKYSAAQKSELDGVLDDFKGQADAISDDKGQDAFDTLFEALVGALDGVNITQTSNGGGINPDGTLSRSDYAEESDEVWGKVTNDSFMPSKVEFVIEKAQSDEKTIKDAMGSGNFAVAVGSDLEEGALKALVEGKEVKGAIDAYLLLNGEKVIKFEGLYRIRILLPAELRGVKGLQVVYVNADGGLEIFKTDVDGDFLEFTTAHFSEFVILGETELNLWWVIILLAVILAGEIVGIVLELRRRKKKKSEKVASVAPLALLTVIIPNGAIAAIIALACCVVGAGVALAALAIVAHGKKKAAAPVSSPEPMPEPAPEPAPAPAPAAGAVVAAAVPVAAERFIRMRYDRSFTARLIQADDVTKRYYCMIKAEILSYGAKSRISWKHETFRAGKLVIKMTIRGKKLCVFFALPAAMYLGTKYKVEDMGEIAAYEKTPCLYRIVNDRRARYSFDLIAAVMATVGRGKKGEFEVTAPPYEETEPLIRRGLIRLVAGGSGDEDDEPEEPVPAFHSVRVSETNILGDEVAASLVSTSVRYADKTRTGIINVDTLSQYFEDGETVTLGEIKKRIQGYTKVTYIKVLARGTLDKALTVEADEFSIEAVKMIVLTGGKVIRTRRIGE